MDPAGRYGTSVPAYSPFVAKQVARWGTGRAPSRAPTGEARNRALSRAVEGDLLRAGKFVQIGGSAPIIENADGSAEESPLCLPWLSDADVTSPVLDALASAEGMRWLDLGNTAIGDAFVMALCDRGVVSRLECLSLENTGISDVAIQCIAAELRRGPSELTEFTLFGCPGITDVGANLVCALAHEGRIGRRFISIAAPNVSAEKQESARGAFAVGVSERRAEEQQRWRQRVQVSLSLVVLALLATTVVRQRRRR